MVGSDNQYNVTVVNVIDKSMTIFTQTDVIQAMLESNRKFALVLKKTDYQDARQSPQAILVNKDIIFDQTAEELIKVAKAYHVLMAFLLCLSIVSYFFGNKNLLLLWNFYSYQQLIVHFALFDLNMPSNLYHTFSRCSEILKYGVFSIINVSKELVSNDGQNASPFNSNFASFGYNSRYFTINMDLPLYFYLAYPIILIILLVLMFLGKNSQRLTRFRK